MLRTQVVDMNKKTDALNQKMADYSKRKATFEEKAKMFNEEVGGKE
jgi:hypothetical protein